MKNILKTVILIVPVMLSLLSIAGQGFAQGTTDYLSVPGPLGFEGKSFDLVWSSHPSANYYKQEYIPSGETVERFNEMVLIEVLTGGTSLEDAMNSKVNELTNRKKTDPYANHDVIKNPKTGEYILDFLVSNSNGNEADIVEWNAYRYVNLREVSDNDGVLLFAISRRSYGDNINEFLRSLKDQRPETIKSLSTISIPEVRFRD